MYNRHRRPALHRTLADILPGIAFLAMLFLCLTAEGWVELIL